MITSYEPLTKGLCKHLYKCLDKVYTIFCFFNGAKSANDFEFCVAVFFCDSQKRAQIPELVFSKLAKLNKEFNNVFGGSASGIAAQTAALPLSQRIFPSVSGLVMQRHCRSGSVFFLLSAA